MSQFTSDFNVHGKWQNYPSPAKWSAEIEKQVYALYHGQRTEAVTYQFTPTSWGHGRVLQTCQVYMEPDGLLMVDTGSRSENGKYRFMLVSKNRNANNPFRAPVSQPAQENKELQPASISTPVTQEAKADDKSCVVCMVGKKDHIILPCMHMCLCADCVKPLLESTKKCPMCREPVTSQNIKKVFG